MSYLSTFNFAIIIKGDKLIRIKELRKEKGLTQLQIQMKLGIEQSYFSKLERGVFMPTIEQCVNIAKFFNTSVDYLLGITNIKEPYPRTDND